jgi:hypothetical protein
MATTFRAKLENQTAATWQQLREEAKRTGAEISASNEKVAASYQNAARSAASFQQQARQGGQPTPQQAPGGPGAQTGAGAAGAAVSPPKPAAPAPAPAPAADEKQKGIFQQALAMDKSELAVRKFEKAVGHMSGVLGDSNLHLISQFAQFGKVGIAAGAVAATVASVAVATDHLTHSDTEAAKRTEDWNALLAEHGESFKGLEERYGTATVASVKWLNAQKQWASSSKDEFSTLVATNQARATAIKYSEQLNAAARERSAIAGQAQEASRVAGVTRENAKQIELLTGVVNLDKEEAELLVKIKSLEETANNTMADHKAAKQEQLRLTELQGMIQAKMAESDNNLRQIDKDRVSANAEVALWMDVEGKSGVELMQTMKQEESLARQLALTHQLTGQKANELLERQKTFRANINESIKGTIDLEKDVTKEAAKTDAQYNAQNLSMEDAQAKLTYMVAQMKTLATHGALSKSQFEDMSLVIQALSAQIAGWREQQLSQAKEAYETAKAYGDAMRESGQASSTELQKQAEKEKKLWDARTDAISKSKEAESQADKDRQKAMENQMEARKKLADIAAAEKKERVGGLTAAIMAEGGSVAAAGAAAGGPQGGGGPTGPQWLQDAINRRAEHAAGAAARAWGVRGGLGGIGGLETVGDEFGNLAGGGPPSGTLQDRLRAGMQDPDALRRQMLENRRKQLDRDQTLALRKAREARESGDITAARSDEDVRKEFAEKRRKLPYELRRDAEQGTLRPNEQRQAEQDIGNRIVDTLTKTNKLGNDQISSLKDTVTQLAKIDTDLTQNAADIAWIKAQLDNIANNGQKRRAMMNAGARP